MNNVYIVTSVKWGVGIEVCEVYLDKQFALGRASALAHFAAVHHPEWIKSPKETVNADGSRRWNFLESYSDYVTVSYKEVNESVLNKHDVEEIEKLLKSVFSDYEGCIHYNKLVSQLKTRDPEDFLVEVLNCSDLLSWRRTVAGSLRDHWAMTGRITPSGLEAHWQYAIGQLSHDPEEFERMIHTICGLNDEILLKQVSSRVLQLHREGTAIERHWAGRVKYYLDARLKPTTQQVDYKLAPFQFNHFDIIQNSGSSITDRSLHLTIDDIRAVVFDSEKYSIDFDWAKKHCEQCSICKSLVDDERAENPLLNLFKDQALSSIAQSTPDDPMDRSLPAGWMYGGKPATMADLFDDPYNVLPIYNLSEAQKWALVTSRVSKRPNFIEYLPATGNCNQSAALLELKNKTNIGKEIVLLECARLDQVLAEQKEEESSSSSEEEDY